MKLESQVCSLDLAKKLKELGVRQESAFYWQAVQSLKSVKGVKVDAEWHLFSKADKDRTPILAVYDTRSAFSVAELGEMLKYHGMPHWSGSKELGYWVTEKDSICCKEKEADARAVWLIYLIEQGIVKPDEQGKERGNA